jgi:hypothetical protein
MARKNYTDEFRRQAVDLYRSTAGAAAVGAAATALDPRDPAVVSRP